MLLALGAAPHLHELSAGQPMAGCAAGQHLSSSVAWVFLLLKMYLSASLWKGGSVCAPGAVLGLGARTESGPGVAGRLLTARVLVMHPSWRGGVLVPPLPNTVKLQWERDVRHWSEG